MLRNTGLALAFENGKARLLQREIALMERLPLELLQRQVQPRVFYGGQGIKLHLIVLVTIALILVELKCKYLSDLFKKRLDIQYLL